MEMKTEVQGFGVNEETGRIRGLRGVPAEVRQAWGWENTARIAQWCQRMGGISERELARRLGVSQRTLLRWKHQGQWMGKEWREKGEAMAREVEGKGEGKGGRP